LHLPAQLTGKLRTQLDRRHRAVRARHDPAGLVLE
jgi:hypothetical protein